MCFNSQTQVVSWWEAVCIAGLKTLKAFYDEMERRFYHMIVHNWTSITAMATEMLNFI